MIKRLVIVALVLAAGAYGLHKYINSETHQWAGDIIARVDTGQPLVALTFDDGPMPGKTEKILDILEAHQVRATFFLVGSAIEAHPEQAQRIVAAGHEVGNHSWTHSRMIFKTPQFVADELERTDAAIRSAGYAEPIHFRPPFGKKLFTLPRYLDQNDIKTITWDVAPETFRGDEDTREAVVRKVLEQARPGSIVLLHVMFDSRSEVLAAVPDIIEGLRERGFGFATVSELLALRSADVAGP